VRIGTFHNALDDARSQAAHADAILAKLGFGAMKLRNIKFFLANLLLRKEIKIVAARWGREPAAIALSPFTLNELASTEPEITYLKTKLTLETTLKENFRNAQQSSNQQLIALWAVAYGKLTPEERSKFDLGLVQSTSRHFPPPLDAPRYEPYHGPD
jgi:hypothetical protein